MANLLNNFSNRKQYLMIIQTLSYIQIDPNYTKLDSINVSEDEITTTRKPLSLGTAAGPDNVNSRILKLSSQQQA